MSNLSFTKLFSSITDSSVWQESSDVRVVWVTLMAMADPLGRVHAAIPGLARRANVSREATEMALAVFTSPDPDSRSKDHDGRRIEEIPGGWRLLNYSAYRELRDEEARKEQNRLAQSKYRQKVSKIVSTNADSKHSSADVSRVSNSKPASAQEEEEVEGEVEEVSTKTTTKTLASTAIAVPAARGIIRGTLPLVDGTHYEIYEDELAEMSTLYPAVDVLQAFRSMKGWMISHPARRKTKRGIRAFITSWLSREQDNFKPGVSNGNRNHGKTAGNLDALEQAERFAREQYSQSPDDPGGEEAGTGFSGDSPDLLDGSGKLLVGRH